MRIKTNLCESKFEGANYTEEKIALGYTVSYSELHCVIIFKVSGVT